MNVDAAEPGPGQNFRRQDQAISDNNGSIRLKRGKHMMLAFILEAFRMTHRQPRFSRHFMDRGFVYRLATSRRPRWLCVHGDDLMPGRDQRIEGNDRKIRRAHKDQSERISGH